MKAKNKKIIYITCWGIVGFLLSFIIHAIIEIPVLFLLMKNFDKFGLGLSWNDWYLIHHILSVIIAVLGIILGVKAGFIAFRKIYIEGVRGKKYMLKK